MDSELISTSRSILKGWSRPARLIGAGVLALLLLIPLGMVQSVVRERHQRYEGVIRDIAGAWSGSQTLAGPMLVIPYTMKIPIEEQCSDSTGGRKSTQHWETRRRWVVMLPDSLKISGELKPETRHRGIYRVQVYQGAFDLKAQFGSLEQRIEGICPPEQLVKVNWSRASISIGLTEPRGIIDVPQLEVNGRKQRVGPATLLPALLPSGFHSEIGEINEDKLNVSLSMKIRGSSSFFFLPLGASTSADLHSSWPDPSFCGEILPEQHESSPGGFSAHWAVSLLNRSYPQTFDPASNPKINEIRAGLRLFEAVTLYDKVTRSAKYGLLFICLSFLSLGLIEYATDSRLSLIQYLLIGMALALFFLLLIAFAEHLGFALAYLLASSSVVLLNTLYCLAFLPKRYLALLVGGLLASIYAILYIILQAEDYALLGGSLLLSLALAVTMYLTRGIHRKSAYDPAGTAPGVE